MRPSHTSLLITASALSALVACDRSAPAPTTPVEVAKSASTTPVNAKATEPTAPVAMAAPTPDARPWKHPGAPRVIAVGDVHGDLAALERALTAAELIDAKKAWSGGNTVLVQTGDLLDRGDDEQEIIDLLDRLTLEARAAGGDVVQVVGNHESMNVAGDLRYVTPGGFADFVGAPGVDASDPRAARAPADKRARVAAFLPGGAYAKRLARYHVVAIVGDTAFAHGGVLPQHVPELDRMNSEMSAWMRGEGPRPAFVGTPDSPMWTRLYSSGTPTPEACATLQATLDALGVSRMAVGHTPQVKEGANSACDGKVWRIDTGMASHYGGNPEAIEITSAGVRRIKTN